MDKNPAFVSVAWVVSDDAVSMREIVPSVHSLLAERYADFEMLVLLEPAASRSAEEFESLLHTLVGLRVLKLATPVAYDVAVAAAFENAIGDFVVLMTPGEDPPSVIPELVERCKQGADIVIGVARHPASWPYRVVRPWVSAAVRAIGYDVPKNATSLRCLSRRAVNAVTQAGRFHHQVFVRMQKTGYPWAAHPYQPIASVCRRTLRRGVKDALRLLVFNSNKPLRWSTGVGMTVSALSLLVGLAGIASGLVGSGRISRVDVALTLASAMSFMLVAMLGFVGEYITRLLDERTEQFVYFISSERNSSVMLNEHRVNVLTDSTAATQ